MVVIIHRVVLQVELTGIHRLFQQLWGEEVGDYHTSISFNDAQNIFERLSGIDSLER